MYSQYVLITCDWFRNPWFFFNAFIHWVPLTEFCNIAVGDFGAKKKPHCSRVLVLTGVIINATLCNQSGPCRLLTRITSLINHRCFVNSDISIVHFLHTAEDYLSKLGK